MLQGALRKDLMSYSQTVLRNLMDVGSLSRTKLNYKMDPYMSAAKGPLMRLILTITYSFVYFVRPLSHSLKRGLDWAAKEHEHL